MTPLDSFTLNIGLCCYLSDNPKFYITRMATKFRNKTKDKQIKGYMKMLLNSGDIVDLAMEIADESFSEGS